MSLPISALPLKFREVCGPDDLPEPTDSELIAAVMGVEPFPEMPKKSWWVEVGF